MMQTRYKLDSASLYSLEQDQHMNHHFRLMNGNWEGEWLCSKEQSGTVGIPGYICLYEKDGVSVK